MDDIPILAIDDSPEDMRLIREMLQASTSVYRLQPHARLAAGLQALSERPFAAVLLDLTLPDSFGLATLGQVRTKFPQVPIVVLTGNADESLALQAVGAGAQDYLVKGAFDGPLLVRAIRYAIERHRAEQAQRAAADERAALERQVLHASTREQQRISQDLHDSVGQELTGLSFFAKSLAKKLAARQLPESQDAERLAEGLRRALVAVQNAIRGLVPVDVDAHGLRVALQRLVAGTREVYGIECRFECDEPVAVDDNEAATHLFRIAQEALHNAVKHAAPREIVIALSESADELRLEVRDDGIGLVAGASSPSELPSKTTGAGSPSHDLAGHLVYRPAEGAGFQAGRNAAEAGAFGWAVNEVTGRGTGMGLSIMQYRARELGATCEIAARPGGGTIVTCRLRSYGTASLPVADGHEGETDHG